MKLFIAYYLKDLHRRKHMQLQSILEKNIQALRKYDTFLAAELENFNATSLHYEIYQSDDPANINYIDKRNYKPLYNKPIEEISTKMQEFQKYINHPILFFFGLGNGVFYKLLESFEKLERIVIYEPDIQIIYMTLSFLDFSKEIEEKKLVLIYTQNYNFIDAMNILQDWQFRFYLKTYDLFVHTPFYNQFSSELFKINDLNIRAIKQIVISHGNDANDSLIGIKHSFYNIPEMIQNYRYSELKEQRLSDTAVVVSTGPSLTKQLPHLKKISKYVTIISVDASLPILEKAGIKPDIVCVLERVELTSEFFLNTSETFMKDIHFVIASLVHEKTLQAIKGKKIITMRPFPYNRYLELPEFGFAGVGMSAANLAFEVAYHMGHKQTILIGQDLAYGKGVSHASGHVLGEDEVKQKETDDYITAYGGNRQIRSSRWWIIFKNTFEGDIATAKNSMTTINATEGGARIEGALEIPFIEATKNLKQKKSAISLTYPRKEEVMSYYSHAIQKLQDAVSFGETKKKEFEDLFLKVAEVWDQLVFLNKTNQLHNINFDKLLKISDEIDELKEIFNDQKFQSIFFDILQPFLISYELELAQVQVRPTNTQIEKQAKIIDWIMKHKEWLFSVAGTIDSELYVIKDAIKHLEKKFQNTKTSS